MEGVCVDENFWTQQECPEPFCQQSHCAHKLFSVDVYENVIGKFTLKEKLRSILGCTSKGKNLHWLNTPL
jgi:hypothetical protein